MSNSGSDGNNSKGVMTSTKLISLARVLVVVIAVYSRYAIHVKSYLNITLKMRDQ